jgi:hypothetical protein
MLEPIAMILHTYIRPPAPIPPAHFIIPPIRNNNIAASQIVAVIILLECLMGLSRHLVSTKSICSERKVGDRFFP